MRACLCRPSISNNIIHFAKRTFLWRCPMRSSKRFFWIREPRPPEIARCSGIRRFIPSIVTMESKIRHRLGAAIAGGLPDRKRRISRIRRTDTAIVRSHFFPAAYAGPPCPRPIYGGYESERYCRNGGYHAITGGKIHPCRTAEAAPVLCASEMDGQSMSISKEKRCLT